MDHEVISPEYCVFNGIILACMVGNKYFSAEARLGFPLYFRFFGKKGFSPRTATLLADLLKIGDLDSAVWRHDGPLYP
jgi:hypothetical protein